MFIKIFSVINNILNLLDEQIIYSSVLDHYNIFNHKKYTSINYSVISLLVAQI